MYVTTSRTMLLVIQEEPKIYNANIYINKYTFKKIHWQQVIFFVYMFSKPGYSITGNTV